LIILLSNLLTRLVIANITILDTFFFVVRIFNKHIEFLFCWKQLLIMLGIVNIKNLIHCLLLVISLAILFNNLLTNLGIFSICGSIRSWGQWSSYNCTCFIGP
jgi:hypothetical protein